MEFCTMAEYSRRLGVSRVAVTKWVKRGWVFLVDGKIDIKRTDAYLTRYRIGGCHPVAGAVITVPRGRKPMNRAS